jgi:hypothetical protein
MPKKDNEALIIAFCLRLVPTKDGRMIPRCDNGDRGADGKPTCKVIPELQAEKVEALECDEAVREGKSGILRVEGFEPNQPSGDRRTG